MNLPSKIKIREVGPRDGFQIQKAFIPTKDKIYIIKALVAAGVSNVEATAFVSPKAVPQMRDAAKIIKEVPRNGTVDRSVADLDGIFSLAAEQGIPMIASIATAFGCPYQGDVPDADVLKLLNAYRSRGAEALVLADTTGMATPGRIERSIKMVQDHYPETEIILHLHDNRGTAMANLLTAMMCGATTFDTSLAGLGGCPYVPKAAGNLPTEDVVYMLDDMGIETGINLEAMILAALQLEKILGKVLSGQVMKSGPRDPERAAELCGINH
jgi:hydroxymethylglutaryl-CoA lyase